MDASAEQFVLDYLRVLEDAAQRTLRPAERQKFLARTRAAIVRQISETRAAEPDDVQRLLRRFGDPRALAAQERRRLDDASPASPSPASPGEAARDDQESGPGQGGQPVAAARAPGVTTLAAAAGRQTAEAPVLHRPMAARWRPGSGLAGAQRAGAPVLRTLPRWPDLSRRAGQVSEEPGGPAVAGPAVARDWLDGLVTMVRSHPLECAAVAVLGVGGLIDPVPLWMLGSLAVLVSRLWDTRDKLIAIAVPLGIALLGAVMLGGLNARTPSLSGYAHGMHTDGWDLIRAGAALGAVYLAWRLRQGPRRRGGPPWLRVPRS